MLADRRKAFEAGWAAATRYDWDGCKDPKEWDDLLEEEYEAWDSAHSEQQK